jgi:glycosyltransferase involved in cell wall biosynthesis
MRVTLLQNFVAPYRVPLYERLKEHLTSFTVLVSTPMESDRSWKVDWGSLDVVVQKNITFRRMQQSDLGFTRQLQIHFPYDTIPQLWRQNPDAIISVELGLRSLQVAIYKILRPSTRFVVWCKLSEHSEREWGFFRKALRRFILKRADAVLVNGESGARYIARFGVMDAKIVRINQPVDVDRFRSTPRLRSAESRTRLLCCGTLVGRKGVLPFLAELSQWARNHPSELIELWWLGDGEAKGALQSFDCPANLQQRFLGNVSYGDLPGWYSQADILVFPSLLDEWGLVVNEAMASGMPVLGSLYAQAVTELVVEGETGWIFDPLSSRSVQEALDRVYKTTPDQLALMRTLSRERIATLTPDTAAAKIYAALAPSSAPKVKDPRTELLNDPSSPAQAAA